MLTASTKPPNVVVDRVVDGKRSSGLPSSSLIVRASGRARRGVRLVDLGQAAAGDLDREVARHREHGVALWSGSIRTSIIVSDRASSLPSPKRWSEPTRRIVCGLPGAARSTVPLRSGASWLRARNSFVKLLSSSSPAVATAPPVQTVMSRPASSMRRGSSQWRWAWVSLHRP